MEYFNVRNKVTNLFVKEMIIGGTLKVKYYIIVLYYKALSTFLLAKAIALF